MIELLLGLFIMGLFFFILSNILMVLEWLIGLTGNHYIERQLKKLLAYICIIAMAITLFMIFTQLPGDFNK